MSQAYLMNKESLSLAHKRPEILMLNRVLPPCKIGGDIQCGLRTEIGVSGSVLKSFLY